MNNFLKQLMAETTTLTHTGRLNNATAWIQKALSKAGLKGANIGSGVGTTMPQFDTAAFKMPGISMPSGLFKKFTQEQKTADTEEFTHGTLTQAGRTLGYKLFVPKHRPNHPLPLIVMLHGCTQNPDDFAAGTAMNERARADGFLVLYPEQSANANPQRCWNWFKHNHQTSGSGEPALIAGMTQAVMKKYAVNPGQVYIAGLSAGGAMAAIVAHAYPELFAAVGVHSGLPNGVAHNVGEALAVMKSGALPAAAASRSNAAPSSFVPTIVFHGDHDQTVHPRNGENVIAAVLNQTDHLAAALPPVEIEQGTSAHGKRYTRTLHRTQDGRPLAEHWVVHGAGHAWSGGNAKGSYTDATGPDATHEMLRFFAETARSKK
jgi:poly(hydroxyalkanoate) depolymerase family esterase